MSRMTMTLVPMLMMMLFARGRETWAQEVATRTQLLQRTFEQLHHEQFDSALAICTELRATQPEDPAGYVMAATVYQAMMRLYRLRLFEAAMDSLSRLGEQLAQKQLRKNENAEGWFMLGSAKGNLALQRFNRGEWAAGLQDAVLALHAMKQAMRHDKSFMDPGLALGLYEYWKSKKLGMGLGLFAGSRKDALKLMEKVEAEARYIQLDATFTLQDLYMHEGQYARALAINEALFKILPEHVSVLYHRAVLLEHVQRAPEALTVWEKLYQHLLAFRQPSHAFIAECQLHIARLQENSKADELKIVAALDLASAHMKQCDRKLEMSGPFENFDALNKAIQEMRGRYKLATSSAAKAGTP